MRLAVARYRWLIVVLIFLLILFVWEDRAQRPRVAPDSTQTSPQRSVLRGDGAAEGGLNPQSGPLAEIPVAPKPIPRPGTPKLKPLMEFQLPTANAALFNSDPSAFFMFVDRYTPEGQIQVWQGGNYGFVRNARDTSQGTIYTKFHEGVDIAPMERDAKGEPQDTVHAIADGVVAYITPSPRTSNYGNYAVVRHTIGKTGDFYSLYAHLNRIDAVVGESIQRGGVIGRMGHTGDGIDRRRAHVHLELGLILSERFDEYYTPHYKLPNGHGNFHGTNLQGLDVAAFLTANHKNPQLMPDAFLRAEEVYYKVTVPNRGHEIELAASHPWMRQGGAAEVSWEISFTGAGVPTGVTPSSKIVTFPVVSWVKPFAGYHSWNTRSILGGSGNTATLSAAGSQFIQLVTGDF